MCNVVNNISFSIYFTVLHFVLVWLFKLQRDKMQAYLRSMNGFTRHWMALFCYPLVSLYLLRNLAEGIQEGRSDVIWQLWNHGAQSEHHEPMLAW